MAQDPYQLLRMVEERASSALEDCGVDVTENQLEKIAKTIVNVPPVDEASSELSAVRFSVCRLLLSCAGKNQSKCTQRCDFWCRMADHGKGFEIGFYYTSDDCEFYLEEERQKTPGD